MEQEYDTIDLRELFLLLKHNALGIFITALVCGIAGFLVTNFVITPMYEASATLIVNTRQDVNANVTNDQITSAKNLVSTYSIIVRSDTVLSEVIKNLRLTESYEELSKKIEVSAVDATQVMKVSMRDADPEYARAIVEEITKVAPDVIKEMVEAGSVKVISEARPTSKPVSPSLKKNTAIALMLGLVVSVGFVFLKELLNTTVKTSEELQEKLGLTVLGIIPEVE